MSVNDDLLSFQIAQQIRLVRLSNTHAKEARAILRSIDKKLASAIIDLPTTNHSAARAKALHKKIREILQVAHADLSVYMKKASTETAEFSSDVESTALRKAIPVAIDIVTPNLAFITTTLARPMKGATLDEWLAKLEADDLSRTYRAIQSGLIEGSATDEIIREVVGSGSLKYKDGVREVTRRGAEMLARTFINHAASMARQAVWEENSDLISSVRWVSTLDGRTSEICRFRDGKLYPVGVGPRPPAHPSCRSTTVAVTKSWRELGFDIDDMPAGTRASMDGQVPSDLTYYQWFKTQSASFQSEVLGVRRYDLWRKGGVTLESFHNDAGRLYTLDQLKAKMPEAYKQAFG